MKIAISLLILVLFFFSCVQKCPEIEFKNFDKSTVDLNTDLLFIKDSIKKFVPVNVVNFKNGSYVAFLKNNDRMLLNYSIDLENDSLNLNKTKNFKKESIKCATKVTYCVFGYLGDVLHFSGCEESNENLEIQSTSGAVQIIFQNKNFLIFEGLTTALNICFKDGKEYIFNPLKDGLFEKNRINMLSGILYKKNNKVNVYMLYSEKNKKIRISNFLDILKLNSNVLKESPKTEIMHKSINFTSKERKL